MKEEMQKSAATKEPQTTSQFERSILIRQPPATHSHTAKSNNNKRQTPTRNAISSKAEVGSSRTHKSVDTFNKMILITKHRLSSLQGQIATETGRQSPETNGQVNQENTASRAARIDANREQRLSSTTDSMNLGHTATTKRKATLGLRPMTYIPPSKSACSKLPLGPDIVPFNGGQKVTH